MRKINETYFYHVYNRGVDKRKIFLDQDDYHRFWESIVFFNNIEATNGLFVAKKKYKTLELLDVQRPIANKLVRVLAYCFCENHYHLILQEKVFGGIPEYMKRVSDGYTKYFNNRYVKTF